MVSGAVVSCGAVVIVQVWSDGVWSVLPAASFARTSKWWEPVLRPRYCFGLAQLAQAEAWVLSRRHSKVEPVSLEENWNCAVVLEVELDGPWVMLVSGGVVSVGGAGGGAEAGPNLRTSCGRSEPFSRLWSCCSASWFSLASRMSQPLNSFEVYIAWAWPATFHSR